MQDDLTGATSTPTDDDSVRAELEAAWDAAEAGDDGVTAAPAAAAPDATPEAKQAADDAADAFARDERGRFAKKEGEQPPAAAEAPADQAQPAAAAAPDAAPGGGGGGAAPDPAAAAQDIVARPPPGWSVQSKAAWDALPPHIKADVAKREAEVDAGFKQYSGVKPYVEMAQQSGTTLPEALDRYVGMENLLRKDFRQGIFQIAHNMGVTPAQFREMFGGVAAAPQPNQNGQQNGAADPALADLDDPYVKAAVQAALGPVTQRLTSLQTSIEERQKADQNRELGNAQKVVDEFKISDKYRYFSDVEGTINDLIEKRMVKLTGDYRADLATAYDMACQLHPEVREALINDRISKTEAQRQADAQKAEQDKRAKAEAARKAGISVRGAPSGPVSAPGGSKGSVRADLDAAWEAHS